jgi:hypothetical protein
MEDIQIVTPGEIVHPEDEINHEHELAVMAGENAALHALRCGQLLLVQKGKLDHGDFEPWIQEHCKFSLRTSQVYTQIAKAQSSALIEAEIEAAVQQPEGQKQLPDLGGATSIAKVLRQITAANPPAEKKPKVEEPKEVVFSWFKEPRVEAMLDGMQAIRAGVDELIHDQRDPDTAKHILKNARTLMREIAKDIDDVLGGDNE